MIGRRPSIVSALEALRPKAQWTLAGDSYTNLQSRIYKVDPFYYIKFTFFYIIT